MDPYFLRLPVNTDTLSGTLTKRPLLQTANVLINYYGTYKHYPLFQRKFNHSIVDP